MTRQTSGVLAMAMPGSMPWRTRLPPEDRWWRRRFPGLPRKARGRFYSDESKELREWVRVSTTIQHSIARRRTPPSSAWFETAGLREPRERRLLRHSEPSPMALPPGPHHRSPVRIACRVPPRRRDSGWRNPTTAPGHRLTPRRGTEIDREDFCTSDRGRCRPARPLRYTASVSDAITTSSA